MGLGNLTFWSWDKIVLPGINEHTLDPLAFAVGQNDQPPFTQNFKVHQAANVTYNLNVYTVSFSHCRHLAEVAISKSPTFLWHFSQIIFRRKESDSDLLFHSNLIKNAITKSQK